MDRRDVRKSAPVVFAFWYVVLVIFFAAVAALHTVTGQYDLLGDFGFRWLWFLPVAIIVGAILQMMSLLVPQYRTYKTLRPGKFRSLNSNIGAVPGGTPLHVTNTLPDFSSLDKAVPGFDTEDTADDFFPREIKSMAEPYKSLFVDLLCYTNSYKDIPPSPEPSRHGAMTLLTHTLLLIRVMSRISKRWHYKGVYNSTGRRLNFRLNDPAYQFDSADPLILLVAAAHDIGKTTAYRVKDGKVLFARHEHDMTGARLLVRIASFWQLPAEERDILSTVVHYYHHPANVPVRWDGEEDRALSDRLMALMELLIYADNETARVEKKLSANQEVLMDGLDVPPNIDEPIAELIRLSRTKDGNYYCDVATDERGGVTEKLWIVDYAKISAIKGCMEYLIEEKALYSQHQVISGNNATNVVLPENGAVWKVSLMYDKTRDGSRGIFTSLDAACLINLRRLYSAIDPEMRANTAYIIGEAQCVADIRAANKAAQLAAEVKQDTDIQQQVDDLEESEGIFNVGKISDDAGDDIPPALKKRAQSSVKKPKKSKSAQPSASKKLASAQSDEKALQDELREELESLTDDQPVTPPPKLPPNFSLPRIKTVLENFEAKISKLDSQDGIVVREDALVIRSDVFQTIYKCKWTPDIAKDRWDDAAYKVAPFNESCWWLIIKRPPQTQILPKKIL